MKIATFITTHLQKGYRHGQQMESRFFDTFIEEVIKKYQTYNAGIDSTIYIGDTGSTDESYLKWIKDLPKNFIKIDIPNHGGAWASMKYLMHNNPAIADNYDYLLFSVDHDAGVPQKDNWAIDLIEKYTHDSKIGIMAKTGIMGRFLDSIKLGPNGLVDHRNCGPHIAKMWGITEDKIIPHLHGNWYFIHKDILKQLAAIWYDPINSKEAMEYQITYENRDFCILARLPDNRRTLDNIHIGREIDLPLRLETIGYRCCSYKGTHFYPNAIEPFIHWQDPKVPVKGFYGEYHYENI